MPNFSCQYLNGWKLALLNLPFIEFAEKLWSEFRRRASKFSQVSEKTALVSKLLHYRNLISRLKNRVEKRSKQTVIWNKGLKGGGGNLPKCWSMFLDPVLVNLKLRSGSRIRIQATHPTIDQMHSNCFFYQCF